MFKSKKAIIVQVFLENTNFMRNNWHYRRKHLNEINGAMSKTIKFWLWTIEEPYKLLAL